ncbi:MAG: hypothetical protein LBK23_12215 [Oscillospiraceae bacterium]|nr:hypothetical protein [Oscillospiraceae bacterium]
MTEALRGWIFGIVGAAMVSAIALAVTPESKTKRVVAVVCGFAVLLALIKPVKSFDYGAFSRGLTRLRGDAEEFSAPLSEANENLTRRIIEEKYAAYILDKGSSLGMTDLSVAVTAEPGADGYWYPGAVSASTEADEQTRGALARYIESGLGVPPEKLSWIDGAPEGQGG